MDKKTLLSYQPFYYKDSKVMENINNCNAIEITILEGKIRNTLNQFFLLNADTSLDRWEKEFGINVNTNISIEGRRKRILYKLRGLGTSTTEAIKKICESFVKEVEVIEHNEKYYFELDLIGHSGFPHGFEALYNSIEEVKPSHLGVNYKLIAITESNLYVGATSFTGEIITTYPWTPTNIESKINVYLPIAQYAGLETITTYPKEVK